MRPAAIGSTPTRDLLKMRTMRTKRLIAFVVTAWSAMLMPLRADEKADELFQRAVKAAAQREHEKAIADLDQAIKLDPKNGRAYDKRGEERFKIGRFKES